MQIAVARNSHARLSLHVKYLTVELFLFLAQTFPLEIGLMYFSQEFELDFVILSM